MNEWMFLVWQYGNNNFSFPTTYIFSPRSSTTYIMTLYIRPTSSLYLSALFRFNRRPFHCFPARTKPITSLSLNRNTLFFPAPQRAATVRYVSSLPPAQGNGSRNETSVITRENIYTIPNALTLSRILVCPVLGWSILDGNFQLASGILVYAGVSDWVNKLNVKNVLFLSSILKVDGFLARRYHMRSVLGTILDPAADKILMTTLTVTLAMEGLLPSVLLSSYWPMYNTHSETLPSTTRGYYSWA